MKIMKLKINNFLFFLSILIYTISPSLVISSDKINVYEDELNTIESYYWIGLEEKGNYELFLKAFKKIENLEKKNKR